MKFNLLLSVASLFLANSALAGCYNWEEANYEDPQFHLICFKDKCDITRAAYECANIHEVFIGLEVGWQIGSTSEPEENYATWDGNRIPADQHKYLRCFEFEDETLTRIVNTGTCWGPRE